VPGGGLSFDGSKWLACQPGFFLPVRVLSRVFRGKFLALLRVAFDQGKLSFHGKFAALTDPRELAVGYNSHKVGTANQMTLSPSTSKG